MPLVLCRDCLKGGKQEGECWIESKTEVQHRLEVHMEGMQEDIIFTIKRASEQVDFLYRKFGLPLINGEGWLLQKALQYFPYKNARVIYDAKTGNCELIAPIEIFADALKHLGTISRLGRAWRRAHADEIEKMRKQPMDIKAMERDMEFKFSTEYWARNKEGGFQ